MTDTEELADPTTLSPDEAFDVLGNDTRIGILRALGEADGPVSFTELRDRVGLSQGAQFNYHLDKVVGHFVRKTEDGYELRQAGRRVMYAVLSEAITDAPVFDRTRIDHPCSYCGARIEVRYNEGHLEQFCTECDGAFERDDPDQGGYLGCLRLPPAGLEGQSPEEAFHNAWVWTRLSIFAIANGICPHCSAPLDRWVDACDDHDATEGRCETCRRRHAVQFEFECTNCIYDGRGTFGVGLAANTDLLAFLTGSGLNPVSAGEIADVQRVLNDTTEVVRSTDPFEAELTFTADGDALTLTIDDDLNVVEATRRRASEPVR